jgi:hypothetical protein
MPKGVNEKQDYIYSKWPYIINGLLLGFFFNYEFGEMSGTTSDYTVIFPIALIFGAFIFIFLFLSRLLHLPLTWMLRWSFLGIAVLSFFWALSDVFTFYDNKWYLGSWLASVAFGGLLSLMERMLDLHERELTTKRKQ